MRTPSTTRSMIDSSMSRDLLLSSLILPQPPPPDPTACGHGPASAQGGGSTWVHGGRGPGSPCTRLGVGSSDAGSGLDLADALGGADVDRVHHREEQAVAGEAGCRLEAAEERSRVLQWSGVQLEDGVAVVADEGSSVLHPGSRIEFL